MVWTWNIKKLKSLFKRVGVEMYEDAENMEKNGMISKKISWSIKRKELLVEQIASKEFEIENLQETSWFKR
jgi:hypothetical protein